MLKNNVELSLRFINGLKNYDIKIDEIQNNFKYCGGNRGSHLNYFRLSCPSDDIPELIDECICGQKIIENCYITDGDRLVVLGNCCIKRFCEKNSRTCEICNEIHRNTKQNRCNNCKIIEKKTTKKLCIKCGVKHLNRVVNKCNKCRNGFCDTCDKYCSNLFKNCCYDCNTEKNKLIKLNNEKEQKLNVNYCKDCYKETIKPFTRCFDCFKKERHKEHILYDIQNQDLWRKSFIKNNIN